MQKLFLLHTPTKKLKSLNLATDDQLAKGSRSADYKSNAAETRV